MNEYVASSWRKALWRPCRNSRCDRTVQGEPTLCPACYQIMFGGVVLGAFLMALAVGLLRWVLGV